MSSAPAPPPTPAAPPRPGAPGQCAAGLAPVVAPARLDHPRRARPLRPELLGRLARDRARRAASACRTARSSSSRSRAATSRRSRRRARRSRASSSSQDEVRGREADDEVQDGDPDVREPGRALGAARAKKVVVNAEPLESGRAVLAEPPLRLRPDAAPPRPPLLRVPRAPSRMQNVLGSFGRSRATAVRGRAGSRVTFADVAGIDEAKDELPEVVDFLRNPEKYRRLGRADPARRAADAARPAPARRCSRARSPARPTCPFFSIAASEFVEAIVGVGASRVRDLFEQAKAGRAGDHLHRRARRRRRLAHVRHRRLQRRQRRARADAQPDPHRDGRLRPARRA